MMTYLPIHNTNTCTCIHVCMDYVDTSDECKLSLPGILAQLIQYEYSYFQIIKYSNASTSQSQAENGGVI